MNKAELTQIILDIFRESPSNFVPAEEAIRPNLAGMQIFDEPLVGIGAADDALFAEYKKPGIIGPWHLMPREWMPEARSVVSLFFPFTEEVRISNRAYTDRPSDQWLHGRIEGQIFLCTFIDALAEAMRARGIAACVPMTDSRFLSSSGSLSLGENNTDGLNYTSNWSERHAAYVCGLGTFGLSKGLITEKGIAGRFTSIILAEELPSDARPYTGVYDYCIRCGACARRCTGHAITLENGKDHTACKTWVGSISKPFAPRFGCGLCQTGVPCETKNPSRRK